MRPMTRRERRTERQRRYLMKRASRLASPDYQASGESGAPGEVDYEAALPGWLKPLDYKVSGETGALRVPSKIRMWQQSNGLRSEAPETGRRWDRAGPTYLIEIDGVRLEKPIIYSRRRRVAVEDTATDTTE